MRLRMFRFGQPARRKKPTARRKLALESLEIRTVFSANPVGEAFAEPVTCQPEVAPPPAAVENAYAAPIGPAFPALVDRVLSMQFASNATAMRMSAAQDGPEGEPQPPDPPPPGAVPVIYGFDCFPVAGQPNTWTFLGSVHYHDLNGVTVELGGLIPGVTLAVDANDGYFEYTHTFPANSFGEVTAQAFTPTGVFSNIESLYVEA